MKRLFSLTGILTLLAVLAAACGGGTPAPAATATTAPATLAPATSVPATSVPVPQSALPTNTPAQATVAPTSGGSSSAGGGLSSALNNAKAATTFRMDMQVGGQGAFGMGLFDETPAPGDTPVPTSTAPITLFAVSGSVNGKDSDFKMSGLLAAFLGADPNTGTEVITVGDKSYIHGPVPLLNANEAKWYVMPSQDATSVQPPLTPSGFLDALSQGGLSASDFTKTGTESLDNQSCDVYTANQAAVQKGFADLGQGASGNTSTQVIDSGDFRFWTCGDGYLHQVKLTVNGHNKDNPTQTGSFTMSMHMYDINNNSIQIQAPAGAEPLSVPSFFSTDTPTP